MYNIVQYIYSIYIKCIFFQNVVGPDLYLFLQNSQKIAFFFNHRVSVTRFLFQIALNSVIAIKGNMILVF